MAGRRPGKSDCLPKTKSSTKKVGLYAGGAVTLHAARILLEHIIGVYNFLPHVSTPVKAPADARTFSKQKFWSDLPQEFDT